MQDAKENIYTTIQSWEKVQALWRNMGKLKKTQT